MVPDPLKAERVALVMVMSPTSKSLAVSLRVMVMVSVSPATRVPDPARVIVAVGGVVSAGGWTNVNPL